MRIASAGAFVPLAHPVDDTSPAAAGAEGHQARMPVAARPRIAGRSDQPERPGEPLGPTAHLPFARHEVVDDSPIVCVLTRFGLRRPWHLIQTYLAYRWLMRRVRRTAPDALLKAAFLVENLTTCYSLSIWANESALTLFDTSTKGHVAVARDVFGRLRFRNRGPELWSTTWRLHEVSNNLSWDELDLRRMVNAAREEAKS